MIGCIVFLISCLIVGMLNHIHNGLVKINLFHELLKRNLSDSHFTQSSVSSPLKVKTSGILTFNFDTSFSFTLSHVPPLLLSHFIP